MSFFRHITFPVLLLIIMFGTSCASNKKLPIDDLQIAVIADVHLQDVYGTIQDSEYKGTTNPKNERKVLIRTMGSQLRSTRIFNENYFAFLAALDDVVKRKVKFVLLPGDFSDDGQPIHIRGLKQILEEYSKSFGISFYLIPGNHDVVQPFARHDGKIDFLGEGGKQQPLMSGLHMYSPNTITDHSVVITHDIQNLGYKGITDLLGGFGFFPQKNHLYWASPFGFSSYEHYNFREEKKRASLEHRSLLIPGNDVPVPDMSYLVEPINGLWLLALDVNTYLKKEKTGKKTASQNYPNTGLGHDNLLKEKKYLMDWVSKVVEDAEKRGKTLIAFSHYPMVDFTNGASKEIDDLLIGGKMQLNRVPLKKVAETFADAGLKLHFGGHMHMNDTGVRITEKGKTLVNIQVPSLAAYMPAYKLLTIKKEEIVEVETIAIDSVPRFNEFFDLYRQEHEFLEGIGDENIWDKDILNSKNYHEFITWHLRELVRLRFLNSEWSSGFANFLLNISGKELLVLSKSDGTDSFEGNLKKIRADINRTSVLWTKVQASIDQNNLIFDRFDDWSGYDLVFDLYRLRSADELAFKDIGQERLNQYRFIIASFLEQKTLVSNTDPIRRNMVELMALLKKFLSGATSDHFEIDLNNGTVRSLKIKKND